MSQTSRSSNGMRGFVKAGISSLIILLALAYFIVPPLLSESFSISDVIFPNTEEVKPKVAHIATPKPVKGIYMTACYAGSKSLRDGLVKLIEDTELNAVVIDIKDFSGKISFLPNDSWKDYLSDECSALDMIDFIKELHSKNIYVIGRITSFQDPYFAKQNPTEAVKKNSDKTALWKDKKGISYLDPGSVVAREHLTKLALDSYNAGFDEVNFDYIRFPSDGPMNDIYFPYSEGKSKPAVMEGVYKHLHDKLKPEGVVISVDLFGMVTTNTDDLNIGQTLESALPYFDFIDPMVYPSHYPSNFNGWKNPNTVPYELIHFVLASAVRRTEATSTLVSTFDGVYIASSTPKRYTKESFDKYKIRPWLQDFDYGGNYGVAEVKAQIKATYDVGLDSFLMWDPSNKYTPAAFDKSI